MRALLRLSVDGRAVQDGDVADRCDVEERRELVCRKVGEEMGDEAIGVEQVEQEAGDDGDG